jgi:hypothetical protein
LIDIWISMSRIGGSRIIVKGFEGRDRDDTAGVRPWRA